MRSGREECVRGRQREAESGVEQRLPLSHHLAAAASQQDPRGLVREALRLTAGPLIVV